MGVYIYFSYVVPWFHFIIRLKLAGSRGWVCVHTSTWFITGNRSKCQTTGIVISWYTLPSSSQGVYTSHRCFCGSIISNRSNCHPLVSITMRILPGSSLGEYTSFLAYIATFSLGVLFILLTCGSMAHHRA